jgi:mitogen-activated protein kinase kinase
MPETPGSPSKELEGLSLDEMRSPRSSSSYPINADIQARLMAFQEKRQSKQQESKVLELGDELVKQEFQEQQQLQRKKSLEKREKPLPPLPPTPSQQQPQQQQSLPPQRLNPQRPAPSIPNTQVSPQVAARMPQVKPSLSMRRGMKLPGGLPSLAQTQAKEESKTVSDVIDKKGKPQSMQLKGLFANYSKYVDIKSGSLNFAGKLSLDSKGINFNGKKFNISADDLQFIEELGRGNYGTVSKVLHKPTGIIMAMKEVRLELDDSKFRQILMELEVLHKCNSPYIVDFYGAFFVEGAVYMCMEFMDGGSLDKIYGTGVDEPHLKFIAESVILGLNELKEAHNVIHRDVKPTNILVNTAGKVKLCDFGVSGNLVASLAKTNIGCQSYMAPERIKSQSPDDVAYTVQSDIWSLGLSILETAKGCYPYPPETYNNIFSQLSAIVDGEPPSLPPGFSEDAHDFMKHCLDKIPDNRPNYSKLLQHPWLQHLCDEADMAKYIKERLEVNKREKGSKDKEDYEELNQKLKPALHRGGALKG